VAKILVVDDSISMRQMVSFTLKEAGYDVVESSSSEHALEQIDGIVYLVADTLEKDPTSGQLFVFRNKFADKLKMLYWDDQGFWLLYKRFEKARFKFPRIIDGTMALSTQQLQWLLTGIDFT